MPDPRLLRRPTPDPIEQATDDDVLTDQEVVAPSNIKRARTTKVPPKTDNRDKLLKAWEGVVRINL
eukprot:7447789-Karenia_brevis.AAC.1